MTEKRNLKLILGVLIFGLIVTLGISGFVITGAFFFDTETSTNNFFQAGTLDLNLEGGDSDVVMFLEVGLKPGDADVASGTLLNDGTLSGLLSITAADVRGFACTVAGKGLNDGTEYCDGNSDLVSKLQVALYVDVNQNGAFDGTDIGLKNDQTTYAPGVLDYALVSLYDAKTWSNVETLVADATDDIVVDWRFPEPGVVDNAAQGDAVEVDFSFVLTQA